MSVLLLFVGMACTMLCTMIKDSSGASCSSTDLATSVSLTSGVVCQDVTIMNMTCTILGTTALVWSSGIDQQSFLVRAPPGTSKVLSVTKTLSCALTVSWAYAENSSIQSAMTCWSPGGWAGMNGANITCLSDNTASCSDELSVSSCSSNASSPANTSSSPANTPSTPAIAPLGAIIGGVVTAAAAITVVTIIVCVCTSTTIKGKGQTLHDTSTSSGVALQSVSLVETQTCDGSLVMPRTLVARQLLSKQKGLHRTHEEDRTGEENTGSIKPMQTYCDPLNQARDLGSGNPPSGGLQEVSGCEAPSIAVHAPPPVLFAVPPEGVVVSVQPRQTAIVDVDNLSDSCVAMSDYCVR